MSHSSRKTYLFAMFLAFAFMMDGMPASAATQGVNSEVGSDLPMGAGGGTPFVYLGGTSGVDAGYMLFGPPTTTTAADGTVTTVNPTIGGTNPAKAWINALTGDASFPTGQTTFGNVNITGGTISVPTINLPLTTTTNNQDGSSTTTTIDNLFLNGNQISNTGAPGNPTATIGLYLNYSAPNGSTVYIGGRLITPTPAPPASPYYIQNLNIPNGQICLNNSCTSTVDVVSNAYINSSNDLVITFTDGTSRDLGTIQGPAGRDGTNGTNGTNGRDATFPSCSNGQAIVSDGLSGARCGGGTQALPLFLYNGSVTGANAYNAAIQTAKATCYNQYPTDHAYCDGQLSSCYWDTTGYDGNDTSSATINQFNATVAATNYTCLTAFCQGTTGKTPALVYVAGYCYPGETGSTNPACTLVGGLPTLSVNCMSTQ